VQKAANRAFTEWRLRGMMLLSIFFRQCFGMCRPPFAVMGVFDVADRKELVGLTLFLDARFLSLAVRAEKGF